LVASAAPRVRSIALAAGGLASTVLVAAHCDAITLPWPELFRPAKVSPMSLQMAESVQGWQREIVEAMTKLDGVPFAIDTWGNEFRRGTSCVLENGNVFEKAAVNTTVAQVHNQPPERFKHLIVDHPHVQQLLEKGKPVDLYTASMSLILHPWNPHAPTVHANYRYCTSCEPFSVLDRFLKLFCFFLCSRVEQWQPRGPSILVWRWRRPHPCYLVRRGRSALSQHHQASVRVVRWSEVERVLPQVQAVVRQVLLHQAPSGSTRCGWHLF
jgi:hypothetical protein